MGFVAGSLTSTGFLPQIVKGYRRKRMEDVSLLMPLVLGTGMFLWMVYGMVRGDAAIVAANVAGVSLTAAVVALKVHYDARGNKNPV